MATGRPSRLSHYHVVLKAISLRTRTSLPSLITSFAILHEATAVLPVVGIYYGAKHYGLGEYCMSLIQSGEVNRVSTPSSSTPMWKLKAQEWLEEGQDFMEKLGRRYDLWNVREAEANLSQDRPTAASLNARKISGDIANAIFAYGVTKVSG